MTPFYTTFKSDTASTPSGSPAWLSLVTTLLQQGLPLATAIVQANSQTGVSINPNQVPQYIINQLPPQYQPQPWQQPNANTKGLMGMDTTTAIILVVAIIGILGIGAYFITNR